LTGFVPCGPLGCMSRGRALVFAGVLAVSAFAGPFRGSAWGKDAAALLEKGQQLLKTGNTKAALEAFNQAAKADPRDPRAPYLRGVALEKAGGLLLSKGDLAGAEEHLRAAVKADPKHADARFNLGVLLDQQEKPSEAVTAYREAVKLRPADASFHLNLGAALRRTGDGPGALASLKESTQRGPENAAAWANLGLLYAEQKQPEEAEAALKKAVGLDPKYAMAWAGLGRVQMRRKDAAAALVSLGKARKLSPKNATYAADACKAAVDADPVGAGGPRECKAALGLEPQNALARYMLAKALVARGDCAGAKREVAAFSALSTVKPEAKAGAEALLGSCKPGVKQKPTR
jgi:tetratricopeptide (TPR) repeat protein